MKALILISCSLQTHVKNSKDYWSLIRTLVSLLESIYSTCRALTLFPTKKYLI